MPHLVAEGPEDDQVWCREFTDGKTIRLGRAPAAGWAVPWDKQISREHADLTWRNGQLNVQQLAAAQNPLRFESEVTDACILDTGDAFRIGHTVFRLVEEPPGQADVAPSTTRSLGDYQIVRKLGTGGMGSVFLAIHTPAGRQVALKLLGPEQSSKPELVKRFQIEGETARGLSHPNLVQVFETGTIDGSHFIAQEFIDGLDIGELIRQRGALKPKRAISIIRDVANGLAYLHERQIIHRDIKPSNLLISRDGVPRLADMGLARSLQVDPDSAQVTVAGTVLGTIDYIAPEQADNSHQADARSDIYSLGCTWDEMLTGSPPYPDGSLTEKIHAHFAKPPPDPRKLNPDVPEVTVAVLARMMAKSPSDRQQTIHELIEDLSNETVIQAEISNSVLARLSESVSEFRIENETPPPAKRKSASSQKSLVVSCVACGRSYRVRAALVGRRLKCRKCGEPIEPQAQ